MKKTLTALVIFTLASAGLMTQTTDTGRGVFVNMEGKINIVADAGLVERFMESDYVMIMLYMLADPNTTAKINRDTVWVMFNNEPIKMPVLSEFREAYRNENRDARIYDRLGKDQLIQSQLSGYPINRDFDFFPLRSQSKSTDQATLSGSVITKTKLSIKNPGFKPGDRFLIAVRDVSNPDIKGAVAVVLQ